MDVEIKLDKERLAPKIVIHTSEMNEEISDLIHKLTDYNMQSLVGIKMMK